MITITPDLKAKMPNNSIFEITFLQERLINGAKINNKPTSKVFIDQVKEGNIYENFEVYNEQVILIVTK